MDPSPCHPRLQARNGDPSRTDLSGMRPITDPVSRWLKSQDRARLTESRSWSARHARGAIRDPRMLDRRQGRTFAGERLSVGRMRSTANSPSPGRTALNHCGTTCSLVTSRPPQKMQVRMIGTLDARPFSGLPTRNGSNPLEVKREIEKRPEIEVRHQSDSGAFALEPDSRRPRLPLGDLEPEPVEDVPVSYPKRPLRRCRGWKKAL